MTRFHMIDRLGITILSMMALAMVVIGVAQADPDRECVGPAAVGCNPRSCSINYGGECASTKSWPYHDRTTKSYNACDGAEGKCEGYDPNYVVCENNFYLAKDGTTCEDKKCVLTTQVPACPAPP